MQTIEVFDIEQMEEGRVRVVVAEGHEIGIVKWQSNFFAFQNRCTHDSYSFTSSRLDRSGQLVCASHHAVFRLGDGEAIDGPTWVPLPVYRTFLRQNRLFVELEGRAIA